MKIKVVRGKIASGKKLEVKKTYDTDKGDLSLKDARYLVATGAAVEMTAEKGAATKAAES